MKLIDSYRKALACVNYLENDDGELEFRITGAEGDIVAPATVESMPLVLPIQKFMTGSALASRVLFHPLSEDVMNGESEVLQFLRKAMTIRFTATFASLMIWMVETAIDPKQAKRFGPKQKEFFNILADANERTLNTVGKLVQRIVRRDVPDTVCKIYLRRTGATFEGKKMTRAAVVTFPFMNEEFITTKDKKTYWCGVEISKKDLNMLRNLVEFIIPTASEITETYNAGSTDPHAPYFDCLIHSFAKLMAPLNTHIKLMGDKYDGKENGFCDTSWVEDFEPIGQYRGQIPSAKYNMGVALNAKPAPTKTVNVAAAVAEQVADKPQSAAATPAESGDAFEQMMNRVSPQQQRASRWEDNGSSAQTSGATGFDGLMARVMEKNGGMAPQNAWGGGGWGEQSFQQQPRVQNGIRRRSQARRETAVNEWTGRRNGSW